MSPERNKENKILVESVKINREDMDKVFGFETTVMSSRALIYHGSEGESLASFHAATLNKFMTLLEGIPAEVAVFDYPMSEKMKVKKMILGFKVIYTNLDNAIALANKELAELRIQEIPRLPAIGLPDCLQ